MSEFLIGFAIYFGYIILAVSAVSIIKKYGGIPREISRKIMHITFVLSIIILLKAFRTWYLASLLMVLFIVIIFPILTFAEKHIKSYSVVLNERRKGEVKRTMVIMAVCYGSLIAIFWGVLNMPYIVMTSVLTWGCSDATSALIGPKYGTLRVRGKTEGVKFVEGVVANAFVSFTVAALTLLIVNPFSWVASVISAVALAAISSVVEVYTPKGLDNLTVPFALSLAIYLLALLFGAVGL
ncbi:MAG: hypothetical protein LBL34_06585 [Clostridiales bacterium]|jgi:dolichol kinase|nr:hypothetical protein [Clostridiales bacterium]